MADDHQNSKARGHALHLSAGLSTSPENAFSRGNVTTTRSISTISCRQGDQTLTLSELLLGAGRWAGILSVCCSSSSVCSLSSKPTAGMQDSRRQRPMLLRWLAVSSASEPSSACCAIESRLLRPKKGSWFSPWGRWAQIPATPRNMISIGLTCWHDLMDFVSSKASSAHDLDAPECREVADFAEVSSKQPD